MLTGPGFLAGPLSIASLFMTFPNEAVCSNPSLSLKTNTLFHTHHCCTHTFDTSVISLQVWFEIIRARFGFAKEWIRNTDLTLSLPGAASIGQFQDIRSTSDVSVVENHAAAQAHPSVVGLGHHNDMSRVARRVEDFVFTERWWIGFGAIWEIKRTCIVFCCDVNVMSQSSERRVSGGGSGEELIGQVRF
jgi:hypothetical protein